jgi:hypothetical protein
VNSMAISMVAGALNHLDLQLKDLLSAVIHVERQTTNPDVVGFEI